MQKILNGLLVILIGIALAALMLEWFVGCGESYIDAQGQHHKYACMFLDLQ